MFEGRGRSGVGKRGQRSTGRGDFRYTISVRGADFEEFEVGVRQREQLLRRGPGTGSLQPGRRRSDEPKR